MFSVFSAPKVHVVADFLVGGDFLGVAFWEPVPSFCPVNWLACSSHTFRGFFPSPPQSRPWFFFTG